ncbi:MAG TPA: hypothetical protein VIL79_04085 [Thermoleophilia bacterium]
MGGVRCVALVVAAPAFGYAVTPEDGAYVFPYDSTWVGVAGGEMVSFNNAGVHIPRGTSVWISSGWITYTKGRAQTIPQFLQYKLSIDGDPIVPTFAAGKLIWSKVYAESLYADYPPFNPRLGAKMFARDWWVPLGAPDVGTYEGVLTEKFSHTTTDLMGGYYDGQHHPFMVKAVTGVYDFTFVVQ